MSFGNLLVFERAEKVEFCASCHLTMQVYVDDMVDPESESLAAVHYKNRYIPSKQCYDCHTSYGMFGTVEAKMAGTIDTYKYYTGIYTFPIKMRHPYSNGDCLKCHAESVKWKGQEMHVENREGLFADEMSCLECHDPMGHPAHIPPGAGGVDHGDGEPGREEVRRRPHRHTTVADRRPGALPGCVVARHAVPAEHHRVGRCLSLPACRQSWVGVSILILIGVAILSFRQRHRLFNVQNYGPGEVVFRQGDIGDSVYFIRSGEVEVVREDGPELAVLAKLPAGHYFGEMALLSNEPRNATIRTTAETELAALGKHNFLTMLSILPSTEENILKTIQKRAMER